jgi:hypothetical protein
MRIDYNFKGLLHIVHEGTMDWKYYHGEITVGSGFLDAGDSAVGEFNWLLIQDNAP